MRTEFSVFGELFQTRFKPPLCNLCFFSFTTAPLPLSLVNNFQMQWHRMVLVVRVQQSLSPFASIILRRGESFSTVYARPTESNTQVKALPDKQESHTLDVHLKNTHSNTAIQKAGSVSKPEPGPYSGEYFLCKKIEVPHIDLNSFLEKKSVIYEAKLPWEPTPKELIG